MAASSQVNSSTVPQGFSIYQPALGAQLQFFPAVGTVELDELVHAFIPGPASIQEKRASAALDFFEHVQLTGQNFKFYPVYFMTTPVESPVIESPLLDSASTSGFNESPIMSNWDWSQISTATSRNSGSSRQRRQSSKVSVSRHQTTDFSHLPGMKIMTKDGRDVTNSASRGSKTKEQRDHAHLMRIIKACDSCRRKKIRCDPSHKKRGVSQTHAQQAASKSAKKATKVVSQPSAAVNSSILEAGISAPLASFPVDPAFANMDLAGLSPSAPSYEPWEEFIQYPIPEDYDFFADPEGYLSPASLSSVSATPSKPDTPLSREEHPGTEGVLIPEPSLASPRLPFNQTESVHDYVDFNLFSPDSTCSSLSASSPKPGIPLSQHHMPGADGLVNSESIYSATGLADQTQGADNRVYSGTSFTEASSALLATPSEPLGVQSRQDQQNIGGTIPDHGVGNTQNANAEKSWGYSTSTTITTTSTTEAQSGDTQSSHRLISVDAQQQKPELQNSEQQNSRADVLIQSEHYGSIAHNRSTICSSVMDDASPVECIALATEESSTAVASRAESATSTTQSSILSAVPTTAIANSPVEDSTILQRRSQSSNDSGSLNAIYSALGAASGFAHIRANIITASWLSHIMWNALSLIAMSCWQSVIVTMADQASTSIVKSIEPSAKAIGHVHSRGQFKALRCQASTVTRNLHQMVLPGVNMITA